jgi:hypothetical protein
MSTIILPASCYEEALPDLRAPYLPTQIRPLIIHAPKNNQAPCRIALYTIGETIMDRFNLCCAGNWKVAFTIKTHKEHPKQDDDGKQVTIHYFKLECTLTVFGDEHSDVGEGESASEALAEFNARAQALKRAARWHGPGQCLYVFGGEELIMWRGSQSGKLQVPKSGQEPHRKPYFDNAGKQAVRDEYAKWLKTEGESQFGTPLNHLQIAETIRERALHRSQIAVPDLSRALPDLSVAATAHAQAHQRPEDRQLAPAPAAPAQIEPAAGGEQQAQPAPSVPARRDVQRLPMPDLPAAQEAVEIAESGGFTATVAHALSNLARTDGQEGSLSERQQKTVVNWLVILSELHLTSDEIVEAVQFVGGNGTNQERRQATFSRWLAGKASGQAGAPAEQAAVKTEDSAEVQDSEPVEGEAAPQDADAAALQTARALSRIHKTMDEHSYSDRTIALLAKLSIGLPPKRTLEWAKVPASTMTVLAELLESAAAIGWSADLLGKEVLAAHSRKGQTTAAGRFSAFAGHLTELAEARHVGEAA